MLHGINVYYTIESNFQQNQRLSSLPYVKSSGVVYTIAFARYLGTRSLPSQGPWIGNTEKFHRKNCSISISIQKKITNINIDIKRTYTIELSTVCEKLEVNEGNQRLISENPKCAVRRRRGVEE